MSRPVALAKIRSEAPLRTRDMSAEDESVRREEEREEVVAIDPRRGPISTAAPEEESGVDTRDLESDKKQSDEIEVKRRGCWP